MAFLWDLVARGLSAHPAAAGKAAAPALPEAPALPAGQAIDGLVGLEKIAFAARQAIATAGLREDGRLTPAVLAEAARLIPGTVALDEAAHVAAVLIPYLVDLRREHPVSDHTVDALLYAATRR